MKEIQNMKDMVMNFAKEIAAPPCPSCNDGTVMPIVKHEQRETVTRECPTCKFHHVESRVIREPGETESQVVDYCTTGGCYCKGLNTKTLACDNIAGGKHRAIHWRVCPAPEMQERPDGC